MLGDWTCSVPWRILHFPSLPASSSIRGRLLLMFRSEALTICTVKYEIFDFRFFSSSDLDFYCFHYLNRFYGRFVLVYFIFKVNWALRFTFYFIFRVYCVQSYVFSLIFKIYCVDNYLFFQNFKIHCVQSPSFLNEKKDNL